MLKTGNGTVKAPKAPKVKVEYKPSEKLNSVQAALAAVKNAVKGVRAAFEAVVKDLPVGTFAPKASNSLLKRIEGINVKTTSVEKQIEKKAKTLGRAIAQAETKVARNAAKADRAQKQIDRATARLNKLNAATVLIAKK